MSHKREDYICWDEYFMGVSMLSGMRSKDLCNEVGACFVSEDTQIWTMGYIGVAQGLCHGALPGVK